MEPFSCFVLVQFLLACVDFLDRRGLFRRFWCCVVKMLSCLLRLRIVVNPEGQGLPARGALGPSAEPMETVRAYDLGTPYSYSDARDEMGRRYWAGESVRKRSPRSDMMDRPYDDDFLR